MDNNEAFLEGEFLEEIVNVDDNPGPSHRLVETPQTRVKLEDEYIKKIEEPEDEDDEDEFEEEEITGQIIQGEDGEYYLLMEDDGAEVVEVDDDPANVESQINSDGEEQLVFQSNPVNPQAREKRVRPARAIVQETETGPVEMIQFTDVADDEEGAQLDLAIGAIQTAEANDDHILHHGMGDGGMVPMGMKMRRTRVYGTCRCDACGQSFVNTARLERHLAVHQVFGSFLCPLCGKTYKYEYNLFYHWRRTCRDLNELMSQDDRKSMDVNALRSLVDEVAAKKQEYGPIEIGISRSVLFQSGPLARLEMPLNPLGRRGTNCRACGVVVHLLHLSHHLNLHKGMEGVEPDARSSVGGFYCDLCGLLFRQHFNLIKHWRTNCAEIQANIPEDLDLTLDDNQLRHMVRELLKRASTNEAILEAETQRLKHNGPDGIRRATDHIDVVNDAFDDEVLDPDARREREQDEAEAAASRAREERLYEDREMGGEGAGGGGGLRGQFDDEPGAVFADDFEDDEVHMLGEEAIGAGSTIANRAKWNMAGSPIQCSECFRSFANHGRLERHMAGFHASAGSHHCALCGNRFKYDYNLLYHYRKSCPYTKSYIDKDVRDQMDAASLRKLVRSLAQKDLKLTPQTRPMQRLPKQPTHQSNDAIIRREMMRPILASAPQVLTQPRRGMTGKQCPVCNIMFYNRNAIERHMQVRHGLSIGGEYDYDDEDQEDDLHAYVDDAQTSTTMQQRHPKTTKKELPGAPPDEPLDEDEAPPTLEIQQPGEQVVPKPPPARTRFASSSHHHHLAHHQQHIPHEQQEVQQQVVKQGQTHHLQHASFEDVQAMYERGEIGNGDVVYVQEGDQEVAYTVNEQQGLMDEVEEEEGDTADERDEEAEEAAYAAEQAKMRSMISRPGPSHHQQQTHPPLSHHHHQPQQLPLSRRFAAGGGGVGGEHRQQQQQQQQQRQQMPTTSTTSSGAAAAAARKRPREASIWDDDLLEEDEEMTELQREVDARRAGDAARGGSSAPRARQTPSIMQRRGV